MKFFVTCAKGTEGPLRRELVGLRIRAPRGETGGVSFEGSFTDAMKVCLWSRVAMRVLLEVSAFAAPDAGALYDGALAADLGAYLTANTTLAVSASVRDNPQLHHTGFAALKVKDALVDAIRARTGSRPNVDTEDPDVAVFLHVAASEARLYLDLAGEPLHRRGYRVAMADAPLKETLAAAILTLGGATAEAAFFDPMCGSGTLAIEQALASRRLAPGLHRRFGFERWPDAAQRMAWQPLKSEALALALPRAAAPIVARDVLPSAVAAARANARAAGVGADVTFEVADVRSFAAQAAGAIICSNPPYGHRIDAGPDRALAALYDDIARALSRSRGSRAVLLAGNPDLARAMVRKPQISHRLWNGPIEARLLVYDL